MGKIRSDYESPLIRGMTEEIVDLFGIEDAFLFRFSSADNITNKDPLWDEPSTTPNYTKYRIKCHKIEPEQDQVGDPEGRDLTRNMSVFVAINHLIGAQVPLDDFGEYVTAGDVLRIHVNGESMEFDITKAVRSGWINDSDKFAGYDLICVRREKYTPERKVGQ